MDAPSWVEEVHVRCVECLLHLEVLHQVLPSVAKNLKIHILRGAVVRVAVDHLLFHKCVQVLLIVLGPPPGWKLSDFESGTGVPVNTLCDP